MRSFLLLLCLGFGFQAFSGETPFVKGAKKVSFSESRNSVSFVSLWEDQQIPVSEQIAWLKNSVLNAKSDDQFLLYRTEPDKIGFIHYRYRQIHNGIPVEDGVYYIHTKNGKVVSANGEYYPNINVSFVPVLTAADAITKALAAYKPKDELHAHSNSIVETKDPVLVYIMHNGGYHLSWKVDVFSRDPLARANVFIDAISGKYITERASLYSSDSNGTAVTFWSGTRPIVTDSMSPTQFRLRESGRGGGLWTWNAVQGTDFFDSNNNWNNVNPNLDEFATDLHWISEMTYDFFFNNYGLNSFDGAGAPVQMICHDGMYVNAFWNGTYAAFGDGDQVDYYPLVTPEIVGHEFTHGVVEYSAALVYAGESGALNESFADLFGNTIRFIYTPANATWFIGDQMIIPASGGQPFRNMANPNQFQCADTYGGLWFNNGDIVHYDSGIQNFWYYLLVTGGTGTNDIGNNYAVTGIGLTDAAAIAYRNLAVYLTPNSTFLDARNGAEMAAVDLFGNCSNQQIQTVNAWYAVGVGGIFSGAVIAGFSGSPTYACAPPATVNFFNSSFNATSYQWNFGDLGTSTLTNPTHVYNNPGLYTVTLIATGTGSCIGVDTLIMTNYINITNTVGPITPACVPVTGTYCCGYGITNVTFNTINYNSLDAVENYQDFSCADSTYLIAGSPYLLNVTTGTGQNERVKAWIDFNNDGVFNTTNEFVFQSNAMTSHTGVVYTPTTATLNTPLRMRIISDDTMSTIPNACFNPTRGQAEDYMVTFQANTLPPIANFTSDITTVLVGNSVDFFDLSQFAPTSWSWTFTGGTPGTSTAQTPANIFYNTVGTYAVSLTATNGFGSSSVTQIAYINVVNAANLCQSTGSTGVGGVFYDSGGPNNDYQDNENCGFLINPPCGDVVNIDFAYIDIETSYDFISVYDGINQAAPLVYNFTGSVTNPPTITCNSGKAYVFFTTDFSVVMPGFEGTWTTVQFTSPPVAAFTQTPANPVTFSPVQFTDQSTNGPTAWAWSFGDAGTSTLQNPSHVYTLPGTYTVTLIATNCVGPDTTTFALTVGPNGVGDVSGSMFQVSVFPNPANESTIIALSGIEGRAEAELFNAVGENVGHWSMVKGDNKISLKDQSAGVYFIKVTAEGGALTKKIIIQ